MTGQVRLDAEGAIARVTLSHPGRLNAMSRAMWASLREVFTAIQADARWRCVLLEGEGGAFCAGGDIAEYPSFRFDAAQLRHFHEVQVWGGLSAMLDCDVPMVCAIRGPCMGAGVEIASCCDIRLAEPAARFGAPIARLGFPMAPREMQLVARAAGELTVREMLLQAAVLDADQMKSRGFLHAVLPAAALAQEAQARIDAICALAPQAARLTKRQMRALLQPHMPPPSAARALAQAYDYADSPEHREGVAAFLEKRPPGF